MDHQFSHILINWSERQPQSGQNWRCRRLHLDFLRFPIGAKNLPHSTLVRVLELVGKYHNQFFWEFSMLWTYRSIFGRASPPCGGVALWYCTTCKEPATILETLQKQNLTFTRALYWGVAQLGCSFSSCLMEGNKVSQYSIRLNISCTWQGISISNCLTSRR